MCHDPEGAGGKARKPRGLGQGMMSLGAHIERAVLESFTEPRMARGDDGGEIGHRAAGEEDAAAPWREPANAGEPAHHAVLERREGR